MKLENFKAIFSNFPEMLKEQLLSRKECCEIATSLFPPAIGVKIQSDYHSTLSEYKNDYFKSVADMYCDGLMHYGLNDMIDFAIKEAELKTNTI